ncbi:MAG: hypothetical protein ABIP65_02390 [Vicinamibacterales bacterium]
MPPGNSERSLGLTVRENILTPHPDIKAVFATNDGRTVEPRIGTGTELVTSANAASYKK